jgi:hypothetical protein
LIEHEYEPIPGLPGRLPAGEAILWQGAPEWRSLARRAFHVRQFSFYFAVLLTWVVASAIMSHGDLLSVAWSVSILAGLSLAALCVLTLFAWLTSRTTMYTITNRRVVLRFGIALPISINLPFAQIGAAGLREYDDGTGDIPLALLAGQRVAYLVLWPHVRPWRLARAEPMLRTVPEAARAAQILGRALAAAADQPAQPVQAASAGPVDSRPAAVAA